MSLSAGSQNGAATMSATSPGADNISGKVFHSVLFTQPCLLGEPYLATHGPYSARDRTQDLVHARHVHQPPSNYPGTLHFLNFALLSLEATNAHWSILILWL